MQQFIRFTLKRNLQVPSTLSLHRSLVTLNVDINNLFAVLKGQLKEEGRGRKIKLRMPSRKTFLWDYNSESFEDATKRLGLPLTNHEATYIDDDGDCLTIADQSCIKDLFMQAKSKGPTSTIYIDMKPVAGDDNQGSQEQKKSSKSDSQENNRNRDPSASDKSGSSVKAGISYIRKSLSTLAHGAPKEVPKDYEAQTAKQYGNDFVNSLTVKLGNSLLCGVPEGKWEAHVKKLQKANGFPDDVVELFETMTYQTRMDERKLFPTAGGLRHLNLQAIKIGGGIYGYFSDADFTFPTKANLQIPTQVTKSMEYKCEQTGSQVVRKFSVWPPPASMDAQTVSKFKDITLAVPDMTEIVSIADPLFDRINLEVIKAHGWANQALLVRSEQDLKAFPTKTSPGNAGIKADAQIDGTGKAVQMKDCAASLLIEVFDTPHMMKNEHFNLWIDAIQQRELGKSVGPLLQQCEDWEEVVNLQDEVK